MDAAVDDSAQRRVVSTPGNSSQSKIKRRREDEYLKPVSGIRSPNVHLSLGVVMRDLKRWPDVTSGAVESWLKGLPDDVINREIGEVIYGGCDWRINKRFLEDQGSCIVIRINGGFLGRGWVLRGEKGWEEGSPGIGIDEGLDDGVELKRGLEKRKVWGTDVYTDDSDLGLVLVHAGWIRWEKDKTGVKAGEGDADGGPNDTDVVKVMVRIVPRLTRYTATERNGIRTRGWGNGHDGGSIVVEGVQRVKVGV